MVQQLPFPTPKVTHLRREACEHRPVSWLGTDPAYWQHRADDCRQAAGQTADREARRIILFIAHCADQLAIMAETMLQQRLARETEYFRQHPTDFLHRSFGSD